MGFRDKVKKTVRCVTKPIDNLVDKANGKAKLKEQYHKSLDELNQEEVKLINQLHSDFQNKNGKLAQDKNAAHVTRQNEISKYTKEKTLMPVQLDKEQAERKIEFQLHCKWIKEETQLIRAALEACTNGNLEILKIVLNKKASTRERFFQYCPLHIAAEHDQFSIIELLCKSGVNATRFNADNEDAMDIAMMHGNTLSVEFLKSIFEVSMLLLHTIETNCDNKTRMDVVCSLLEIITDPNATNEKGYNALQLAIMHRREELIPLLIEAKASVTAIDPEGNNILQLALKYKLSSPIIYSLSQAYHDVCPTEDSMNKSLLELAIQYQDTRLKMYFEEQLWANNLIKTQVDANLLDKGPSWLSINGWYASQYNLTIKSTFADVRGHSQLFVLGRSSIGIHIHSYDFTQKTWITHPMGPALSDSLYSVEPWKPKNQHEIITHYIVRNFIRIPGVQSTHNLNREGVFNDLYCADQQYYSTLRLVTARTRDNLDKLFLLVRLRNGIKLWGFDPNTQKWFDCPNGPMLSDTAHFSDPQYYSTIRLITAQTSDGLDKLFLLVRQAAGIAMWSFDPNTQKWSDCPGAPLLGDSIAAPEYYSTINLVASRSKEGFDTLFFSIRQAGGITMWSFDPSTKKWSTCPTGPMLTDNAGFKAAHYYGSIRYITAKVNDHETLFLLSRQKEGIGLWSYDINASKWDKLAAGPLWTDLNGWVTPSQWYTIQLEVVKGYNNTDILMLFGRTAQGLVAHAYHPITNQWLQLPYQIPLTNDNGWNDPQHYPTIKVHTELVNDQHQIFVLGRACKGMYCWSNAMNLNALDKLFISKAKALTDPLSKLELEQVNSFSNTMTALSGSLLKAAELGNWELANRNLLLGAYINTAEQDGNNALQKAIISKQISVEFLNGLIKAGIDFNHLNANKQDAVSLAKIHMPHIVHLLAYEPVMGLRYAPALSPLSTLKPDKFKQRYVVCGYKAHQYLDKYTTDAQKIEAMMTYYYLLSERDPYVLYTFPIMLMLNQLKEILRSTQSHLASELMPNSRRDLIMLAAESFFTRTRATHCTLNEYYRDAELINSQSVNHVVKSISLQKKAQALAARLKTTVNDPVVINSIKHTYAKDIEEATKSVLAEFTLEVFGLGKVKLPGIESLSTGLLQYQKEHEAAVKAQLKASLTQNIVSTTEMIHDIYDIGLILPKAKSGLKERLLVWEKSHADLEIEMNKSKKELEDQSALEKKMLQDWLTQRGKEHNEYLEHINRYLNAVSAAEVDLLKQYNKGFADLKNDFNNARGELYENYYEAKCKAQERFAINLAAIAAAAIIAPQLAPGIAGSLCAGLGIATGTTAAAGISLAIEGALVGSLTAAFSGNTNRILRDGFLGGWMAGFGAVMGNVLEKSVQMQKLNKLFSTKITLVKSGSTVLQQGIVTNAVVSGMKSALHVGLHGGKLSDSLLSSIGTAIALGGSKDLPFIDQLNEKLSSVLISASISSAITKTNFIENAASIGITTLVQTAASSIGYQMAESKAKKEILSQSLQSEKILLAQSKNPPKKNTPESHEQNMRSMFNRNPVPNAVPKPKSNPSTTQNVAANDKENVIKGKAERRGSTNSQKTANVRTTHKTAGINPAGYHTPKTLLARKEKEDLDNLLSSNPAAIKENTSFVGSNVRKMMIGVANQLIPAAEAYPLETNEAGKPDNRSSRINDLRGDGVLLATIRSKTDRMSLNKPNNQHTQLKSESDLQRSLSFKLQDESHQDAYGRASQRLILNQSSREMVSVTKMPVWSSSGTFVQDTHRNYLAEGVELYKNTVNWGKMAVRSTYQELSGTVSKETYQWRARNRDNHPIKAQYTDAMIEHGMYLNEGKKHALYTLGRGFKQLSLELGEKIGIDPGSAARYTAYINEQAYLYSLTPAAHSTCGQWGNGVTHMAIFLLPGGAFLQGTRTILWGMGTAGFTAALYPTQDGLLSTRLGVAMDTAALTGLMGVGLSYAVPAAQSFAPYLYNRARNAFGSVNSIKQVNGDVVLNADLMERAQAVVQQLESSSLNSARQSIIALDTPALIVTKTTATPVNQASAKIVINSDVRLPYSNSTVKSVIKAPTTEGVSVAQLSDVGIYKPEPLMLSERVRIGTWEKARNQYLKNWRNVNVEKISKESQRLLLNSGADEVIKRNMKPDDLAGIFKEARNVKIFDSKGKLVNHLDEWNQASNAMTKLLDTDKVSSIHGRLGVLYKQGQYSSKEAELLRQKLSDLSKLKDTYTKLIEVQKCQINNKFQH